MIWTKVKKRFEALLAPALQGRLQVHVTNYERSNVLDVGRGWIMLDGAELVSLQVPTFYSNNISFDPATMDFGLALGTYPDLSIDAALASEDALLSGLALLDGRCGKRRLLAIDMGQLHPFARVLYQARCAAEGIAPHAPPA